MPRSREVGGHKAKTFNQWDYLPEYQMFRLPVKYQGIPLMPMKSRRVSKFVKIKLGRIRYDEKVKLHYLQLLKQPSGLETQDITMGLDPGSSFDGISVVSSDTHHCNIELIQRPKKGKTAIKFFKFRQATNRRIRRSRLRHRKIRFDNRTKLSLTPTIKANVDFRKWIITKLATIFPITKLVVEDVRFNHAKSTKGRAFSLVEQGKTELYSWIKKQEFQLELYDGFNTKKLRLNSFSGDPKSADKGSRSFEAHCIDSFVLACNKGFKIDNETGELFLDQPIITNDLVVRESVIFIEKKVKIRRCLTRIRKQYNDKSKYYKLAKGGVKEFYSNTSSHRNLCRVKPNREHSNHPKYWDYIDNGFAERYKYNTAPYGGTIFNGVKKFLVDGTWLNRVIS